MATAMGMAMAIAHNGVLSMTGSCGARLVYQTLCCGRFPNSEALTLPGLFHHRSMQVQRGAPRIAIVSIMEVMDMCKAQNVMVTPTTLRLLVVGFVLCCVNKLGACHGGP